MIERTIGRTIEEKKRRLKKAAMRENKKTEPMKKKRKARERWRAKKGRERCARNAAYERWFYEK
jgi:hypothetical protein